MTCLTPAVQEVSVLQRSRLVSQPSHLTVRQGQQAELTCTVDTDPALAASLEIHWLRGEERREGEQGEQVGGRSRREVA